MTRNPTTEQTSRREPRAVSATSSLARSLGYSTSCAESQSRRVALANGPGFQVSKVLLGRGDRCHSTAQTDVTRPYFRAQKVILSQWRPRCAYPYLPGAMQWLALSRSCGSRSGDDATVMIYIPFTYIRISHAAVCPDGVRRHPFLFRPRRLFYWPRQLPTTPEMPAPDERAAELVHATSQ